MQLRGAPRALACFIALAFAAAAGRAAPAARPAAGAVVYLRLAETHPADYPTTKGDYEFARLVEERSGGRVEILVYPGSQLGQERAVIEQVQFGGIDLTRVSVSVMASFAPALNALQMPYLYRDDEHLWKVLKGEVGRELLASLEGAGLVGLGWFEAGSRNFYNSKRPVRSPADLRGLRIRVQENDFMMSLASAFGAIPTPMPYGEVYSGLQTGAIDGAENNWPSYYSTSHYEVARFLTLDEHSRVPEIIIGSRASLGMLSAADQELVARAAFDAIDYQRAEWAKYAKLAEGKVRAAGTIVVPIADKSAWQALMAPLYARQSPEVRALIERIKAVK
jgi:tripartite ATP-independent transporter DctP family solute receptor